jgi:tetratricopeptide (TPR) repeat protein
MKPAFKPFCGRVVSAVLLLMLTGCANRLTAQQKTWLAEGQERYEHEDYAQAIDKLNRFLGEVREGPEYAQALYLRGMSNAKAGRRAQAYADLHSCVAIPSDAEAVWRAYVVLGTLYFEDRQWEPAAQSLRAAAERMSAEPPKDAVLYRLGLCYERTGRWPEARALYAEVAGSYPGGGYAQGAWRRWQLNADYFAVQCGVFRVEDNAETLRANLKRKGLEAYVSRAVQGHTTLYVVLVGRYVDYDQALSHLAMVRQFVADAVLWP